MVYEVLELIYYQQTYSLFSQLMNYSKAVATRSTIAIPKRITEPSQHFARHALDRAGNWQAGIQNV
jgi:hypothetical protein